MKRILVLAGVLSLGAIAWAGQQYTKEQLDARFYFDLGPAQVDVSGYPAIQQQNYKEFAEHCSKCHTLARPINAPFVSKPDWERFVERMHRRTVTKLGSNISKEDAKKIVDFLVYDSHRRKVEQKTQFDAQTQELKKLFDSIQKERLRIKEEEAKEKARQTPMELQTQPAPQAGGR